MITGSAFAAGAQTSVLFGANAGYGVATNGWLKDVSQSSTGDSGNIAGGIFTGYDFALNQNISFGVELDGQYAYKVLKQNGNSMNMWSIPLFATAKLYMPDILGFMLFAKAGYAYNKFTGDTSSFASSNNLWRPVAAAGFGYQIAQFNIFAQYQQNWLALDGQNGGFGTVSAGLSYRLPL